MKKESFVIHTEYIEDLPEENKTEFLLYIYNYGSRGEEPELEGLAKTIWVKIKRRMDADEENYNLRIEGNSKGGSKHKGNQYTRKNGSQLPKLPQERKSMEVNGSRGTVYVNESVNVSEFERENEFVNTDDTKVPTVSEIEEQYSSPPPSSSPQDFGKLQKEIYAAIVEHNQKSENAYKISVSKSEWDFTQKESRELLEKIGLKHPPEEIKQALNNFLSIANSGSWMKTFSWRYFCNHFQDFTQEFFAPVKYAANNAKPQEQKQHDSVAYECPECRTINFYWDNDTQRFVCEKCGKSMKGWEYDEWKQSET